MNRTLIFNMLATIDKLTEHKRSTGWKPFVLVGHSFGGPVVRNFARVYPASVAGMVLVDAAHEGLRVES
jgi:pimeloyl-ACP methyl ester carboxylesterase